MSLSTSNTSAAATARFRALLASLTLHGVVLVGMLAYLLQANHTNAVQAATEVVFDLRAVSSKPNTTRVQFDPRPIRVARPIVEKAIPKTQKPAETSKDKPAITSGAKDTARVTKPLVKPKAPQPFAPPRLTQKVQVTKSPVAKKDLAKTTSASGSQGIRATLPKTQAIKKSSKPITLEAGAKRPAAKPIRDNPIRDNPVPAKPVPAKPVPAKPLGSNTKNPKPAIAATSPNQNPDVQSSSENRVQAPLVPSSTDLQTEQPVAATAAQTEIPGATQEPDSTAPSSSPGSTAAQETQNAPSNPSRPVPTRETGVPTPTGSATSMPAASEQDSGPAESKRNATATTADSGLAGTQTRSTTSSSASQESDPASTAAAKPASTRETGPAGLAQNGAKQSPASPSQGDAGPANSGNSPVNASAAESGPAATKPSAGSSGGQDSGPAAKTGNAGPSTAEAGGSGSTKPAGPSGTSTRESGPSGSGSSKVGNGTTGNGTNASTSSGEGSGLSGTNGTATSAEAKAQRCALVIDARKLEPPLRANMSPAILDPNGRKIWPNATSVQDVDSDLVNETGIASFVSNPQAAMSLLAPGINPLEFRAIATAMSEGVNETSVRDYVIVSASDAQRIAKLGNCQIVFIK
jgi:hypothetical protein